MTNHMIDTIICGAVVDLFHAWNIAVAPSQPSSSPPIGELPDTVASVECRNKTFSVTLYLCCPTKLVVSQCEGERRPDVNDWVREVLNQLTGKIGRRYRQPNAELTLSLCKSIHLDMLRSRLDHMSKMSSYEFRTRWGSVMLIVDGEFDASTISFTHTDIEEKGMILL